MVLSIISAISAVFGLFVCSVLDIHVTRRNCEFFDYFSEIYYDENDAGPSATPIVLPHIDDDDGILWGVVGGGHRHVYGVDGELEVMLLIVHSIGFVLTLGARHGSLICAPWTVVVGFLDAAKHLYKRVCPSITLFRRAALWQPHRVSGIRTCLVMRRRTKQV